MGALERVPCCLSVQQCQHEAESEKVHVDFMEDKMEKGGAERGRNHRKLRTHFSDQPGEFAAAGNPGTPDCNTHRHR